MVEGPRVIDEADEELVVVSMAKILVEDGRKEVVAATEGSLEIEESTLMDELVEARLAPLVVEDNRKEMVADAEELLEIEETTLTKELVGAELVTFDAVGMLEVGMLDEFVVAAGTKLLELVAEEVEAARDAAVLSSADHVMYGSVSSAMASERTFCCKPYQSVATVSHSLKLSPVGAATLAWSLVLVVAEPVSVVRQTFVVEHESVMTEVDSVVAPAGTKTEYEVTQALVICVEHDSELLEALAVLDVREAV